MGNLQAVDPRTGAPAGTFSEDTVDDVRLAVQAAQAAFDEGALAGPDRRTALLRRVAERLRSTAGRLIEVAELETGLPTARLSIELERTCVQLEAFAAFVDDGDYVDAIIDLADGDAKPAPRPDLRRMLVPIGPVAVFGASNMPFAFSTAGGDTASALAAGCPVVVKGHQSHPGLSAAVAAEVASGVNELGLHPGVFGHVLAADFAVGEALVDAPEIAAVGFTGSLRGGRALFDRAAARPRPIPVYAEMGSINPTVITAGAIDTRGSEIAEALASAVSTFGGQYCTKPGVVFVPSGAPGDGFAGELSQHLASAEAAVLLNEPLKRNLEAGMNRLRASTGVTPTSAAGGSAGPGFRSRPAAFEAPASAALDRPELLEEHFGPVVVMLRYADREELLSVLDALDGQLTGAVFSGPDEEVADVAAALQRRVGRLVFDGVPVGVSVTAAQHHGGPYPATTNPAHTSVGITAIRRFLRPIAFQNARPASLPPELQDENPLGIVRRVNGELTRSAIGGAGGE
jgi:NADP-dependent aldehyde dehydrogenase